MSDEHPPQIRPHDRIKRREKGSKPKAVILVPTPIHSVLKYNI